MTTALFTLLGVALSTTDPLASIAHHRILATIEPESGALAIEDRIELLPGAGASALYIGSALQVRSLEAGGKATEFQVEASAEPGRALLSWRGGPDAGTLVIHCTASFAPPAEGEAVELEYQAMAIDALIGEQGAFLSPSAGWYPQGAEDLARFDVVVDVPEGWLAVTEGARATERTSAGRTRIEHTAPFPVDGVHLCAGPYVRGESRARGVARVWADLSYMPHPADLPPELDTLTADFAYVRLIGDRKAVEKKSKSFDRVVIDQGERLQRWADLLLETRERVPETYAYANNHYAGHGPATIRELARRMGVGEG